MVYSSVATIRGDLSKRETEEAEKMHMDIRDCRRKYQENACDPSTRVRALEDYCSSLDRCLARDPHTEVRNSRLTAELIAHILNSFVAPLDLKTIVFIFLMIFG